MPHGRAGEEEPMEIVWCCRCDKESELTEEPRHAETGEPLTVCCHGTDYEILIEHEAEPPEDWPDDFASDMAQNAYESGLRR